MTHNAGAHFESRLPASLGDSTLFQKYNHTTVLQNETVEAILPSREQLLQMASRGITFCVADCTLGGGGHAEYLMNVFLEREEFKDLQLCFIGIDQDEMALNAAQMRIDSLVKKIKNGRFVTLNCNFSDIESGLKTLGVHELHALYADFGVSSPQLDIAERGFSLMREGPLDMRMDRRQQTTAKVLLETWGEGDLARIFFEYGEEPKAKKLAQAICKARASRALDLSNTLSFAEFVKHTLNYGHSRVHPATRVFQALRIAVNDELGAIERLLKCVPRLMSDFGKVGFISFHSLEDRIVKRALRYWESEAKDEVTGAFPKNPKVTDKRSWGRAVPRNGVEPGQSELKANPRARSARLRVFEFAERAQRSGG